MELRINDYVRTRWGYICKIININEFREPSMRYSVEASYLKDIVFIGDEEIIKSSPNIIDLIEVGDYVNGNPVCLIKEDEHNRKWIYTDSNYKCGYLEEDIATILTHEQFEKMMYKIGDINE